MIPIVSMIPKAHSTGGTGIVVNIIAPGPAPHRNDAIAPGPQGFLMDPASPALPATPPMVPGPQVTPLPVPPFPFPYPFAGFVATPAAAWPITRWSNEGGLPVYPGAPPPLLDICIPYLVYDAAGGGPYILRTWAWTAGCDAGCEGWGPNIISYSWDTDGDGSLEYYVRAYARDPGVITLTYGVDDVAVTHVVSSKTVVGQGFRASINVTVANQGNYTETFNVTVYANITIVDTLFTNITLTNGNSTTITFTWNTTGFAKGNYTVWAYAWPVSGETDTVDNTCIDGIVTVTIPGDVDGDHWVFLYDAVKLLSRYGARIGDPQYDPVYDIDNDGHIFLYDAVILLAHYGQKDP